jgi:hypothetical protein
MQLAGLFGNSRREVVEGRMVGSFGSRNNPLVQGQYCSSEFAVDHFGLEVGRLVVGRLTGWVHQVSLACLSGIEEWEKREELRRMWT